MTPLTFRSTPRSRYSRRSRSRPRMRSSCFSRRPRLRCSRRSARGWYRSRCGLYPRPRSPRGSRTGSAPTRRGTRRPRPDARVSRSRWPPTKALVSRASRGKPSSIGSFRAVSPSASRGRPTSRSRTETRRRGTKRSRLAWLSGVSLPGMRRSPHIKWGARSGLSASAKATDWPRPSRNASSSTLRSRLSAGAATGAAAELVRTRRLPLRSLAADWQFDGSSLVFFYASDERVDLAELNAALASHFGTRIEMRKMGARDETKVMTGVGTCGRELCCSSWLDKFSNISIRMAKEQDLPLNQAKLTGVCGRLKCCLIYELEMYQEVKGRLPKVGESFHIPSCEGGKCGTSGCAMTQSVNVPKERITVTLADGARTQFTAAELGVSFQAIPAHTKGVGTYGSDEVPKQERPTPVSAEGEPRRRRRRRGRRRGCRG